MAALARWSEAFEAFANGLRGGAIRGLNVTVPFKETALALADRSSGRALAAGAMVTADGKPYRNRYVFRFDFESGRIKSAREYYNPIISAYAFARPIAGSIKGDRL